MQKFPNNVTKIRTAKGWDIARLARKANLPHSTVRDIESGKYETGLYKGIAIADALGVSVKRAFLPAEDDVLRGTSTEGQG